MIKREVLCSILKQSSCFCSLPAEQTLTNSDVKSSFKTVVWWSNMCTSVFQPQSTVMVHVESCLCLFSLCFGLHHLRRETSVCVAVVGSSMFTRQPLTVSDCCRLLGRSCSAPSSDENSWDWTTQEMCCKIKSSSYKRLKSSTELQRRSQTQLSYLIYCHYIYL